MSKPTFDERKMQLTFELYDENADESEYVTVNAYFEVCWDCNGKGSYVNRAIDGNGISPQEFAEDPDFAEAYFGGAYDVSCETCNGKRVVPEIAEGNDKATVARIRREQRDQAEIDRQMAAEQAAEQRYFYGCG